MIIDHTGSGEVGIVTLAGRFNYGNRLQAYAVQKSIASFGYKPVTLESVDIAPNKRLKNAVKRLIGRPIGIEGTLSPERSEAFKRFNSYINTKQFSIKDKCIGDTLFACISGSDQVWNPRFMAYGHPELLGFVEPRKRIALAASVGASSISQTDIEWFSRGISEFNAISVREKRAAEIVKECTGRDVDVVIDPTMSIAADEWRCLADDRCTPETPYILSCLFGGLGEDGDKALAEVSDGVASIVPLSDRQRAGEPPAGPAEFISLIDNAQHVVSDSFHASVFSMLLGTPLTIVRRSGTRNEQDMFSRLEHFAKVFEIEECIYGSPSFDPCFVGRYSRAYEILNSEREKYRAFLSKALSDVLG